MIMPYYFTRANEIFLVLCMTILFLPFVLQIIGLAIFNSVEFITNPTNKNRIKVK